MIVLTPTVLASAALVGCASAGVLAFHVVQLRRKVRRLHAGSVARRRAVTAPRDAGYSPGLGIGGSFSELESKLGATGEWLALPSRFINDALFDWNVREGVIHFSARWRAMLGGVAEEVVLGVEEWLGRVHPEDLERLQADIQAQRRGVGFSCENRHRLRHEDGRWLNVRWQGAVFRDDDGEVVRIAGSVQDLTADQEVEERLRREALHDPLTGLPNRTLFLDLLRRAMARRRREPDRRFAVLIVDCDRLEAVNDALGHAAGDELLRQAAARIGAIVRPGDVVARLSGDEFALLLEDIPHSDEALRVAMRLQDLFIAPMRLFEHDVVLSISSGVVQATDDRTSADEYLRDAGVAMRRAKANGGSRAVLFADAMREGAWLQMSLEHDLRGAVERGELVVRYQPVWDTVTRNLAGFEALVRWIHPTRGALPPSAFIPIAEESGLIVPIGRWALFEACRQLRQWDDLIGGPQRIWMSVNLAAKQLADPALVASVEEVLRESGLAGERLKLEVTENTIVADEALALATLERLRTHGVRLMMDDFGTGHSSLTYLHRLPIGAIKIDRYFVGRIHEDPECLEIVRSMVTLAQSLSIESVAEGVDHARQLEQLQALGCRYVQGFLLGRPLAAGEAAKLVAHAAESAYHREEFDPRDHGFDGVETALTRTTALPARPSIVS